MKKSITGKAAELDGASTKYLRSEGNACGERLVRMLDVCFYARCTHHLLNHCHIYINIYKNLNIYIKNKYKYMLFTTNYHFDMRRKIILFNKKEPDTCAQLLSPYNKK